MKVIQNRYIKVVAILREDDNKNLQALLDWIAHPSRERSYSDMSGQCEHLYSSLQVAVWIEGKDNVYITQNVRNQLIEIQKELDKHKATYFRIIK